MLDIFHHYLTLISPVYVTLFIPFPFVIFFQDPESMVDVMFRYVFRRFFTWHPPWGKPNQSTIQNLGIFQTAGDLPWPIWRQRQVCLWRLGWTRYLGWSLWVLHHHQPVVPRNHHDFLGWDGMGKWVGFMLVNVKNALNNFPWKLGIWFLRWFHPKFWMVWVGFTAVMSRMEGCSSGKAGKAAAPARWSTVEVSRICRSISAIHTHHLFLGAV